MAEARPESRSPNVISRQLIRCGASIGATYREACRAKSRAGFIAKMGTVEEECDEAIYWMELVIELDLMEASRLVDLKKETDEILPIVVASIKTARSRNPKSKVRGS